MARYERKLGIVADCIRKNNPVDTLAIIKDAGFESFFTRKTDEKTAAALKNTAKKLGLDFAFIHAPFHGVNALWLSGDEYRPLYDGVKEAIVSAARSDVKTVILHVSSGWTPPPVNDLGISRFDSLVEFAGERGVNVAFENLRKLGNLACLMERYENTANVGFCFDCGHEHCYTQTVPFLDLYGNRVLCTHLHDNFGLPAPLGDGDLHLLPFDGNVDFKKVVDKLDEYGYTGSLMLEVFDHRAYEGMPAERFIRLAFERAEKIAKL